MRRLFILVACLLPLFSGIAAQYTETELKVYTFNDGLSHRNVFDLLQDSSGLMWLGTIDGLNRFDGYSFISYDDDPAFAGVEMTQCLALAGDSVLYAAAPDYIVATDMKDGGHVRYKIKPGEIVRRQSLVPTAMEVTENGLFLILQEEVSGRLGIYQFQPGSDPAPRLLHRLPGQYTRRPLCLANGQMYCGAAEDELWTLDPVSGERTEIYRFPPDEKGRSARIAAIHAQSNRLWVMLDDGRLFSRDSGQAEFTAFAPTPPGIGLQSMQALYVDESGDIYLGGFGRLLVYDHWKQAWEDLDAPIRQLVRNTCTYRDIHVDLSGAVWVASDFGAVRITRSDRLFTQYLSGGSEYCSNVFCSTRGITEDDNGLIYVSYYNSIHVVDPATNDVRPLFPANDYFNYPYGLLHYDGYLYTGDGLQIRLSDLNQRSLFPDDGESEGVVALSPDSLIWFSYDRQLFVYNPATDDLSIYRDRSGRSWATISGAPVSFLLPLRDEVFIATVDAGLYRLDLQRDRIQRWEADSSRYGLASNRINSIYLHPGNHSINNLPWTPMDDRPLASADAEALPFSRRMTDHPALYLATAKGLHRLDLVTNQIWVYTEADGLPNEFINGILPEGDTAIWTSTDYGLCRFSLRTGSCLNFFSADGLSSDEFNRISFFRSKSGRLYFGGLNGVNAFTPENRFLEHSRERAEVPLILTEINYVEGDTDSLRVIDLTEIDNLQSLELQHDDRLFNFTFSLADFRHPSLNRYSYFLEGYDQGWSSESSDHRLRLTDLPPGNYTLNVRARVAKEEWLDRDFTLPITIKQPYYYSPWFWMSVMGALLLAGFGILRYRIYAAEKQRLDLEATVRQRTAELAAEQEKSEELLLNILPAETARELKDQGKASARRYEQVTVFFSDFVSFTAIANDMEPEDLVNELDLCFRTFDEIVARYQLEKIKTIGDAYLFVGGLNGDPQDAAISCVKAARDIQAFLRHHAVQNQEQGRPIFRARIGLHTGPLVTGVVGIHKFAYDIWGETVNLASRMEANGIPEGIIVSSATKELINNHFACRPHGVYEEHGKEIGMWSVEG